MCTDIRDTVEADLPTLFRIITDPRVRPMQFKLSRQDTIEGWTRHLFGDRTNGQVLNRCSTIFWQGEIVGHVSHLHYQVANQRLCYGGWNLMPEYWGRGIAVRALSRLFDQFFHDQQIDAVVSDCFAGNHRCIRVMQKLGYTPASISPFERLYTLVTRRCLHWICRFHLTADRWSVRRMGDA